MNAPTTVNLAIQFLPLRHSQETAYTIIDAAIQVVKQSGLPYTVGPFETTIEGSYEQVMNLLEQMQLAARNAGAEELLINMKLHRNFSHDLHITDKTGKYLSA
ncbi:MAG: thiamine-binding protein [Sphingobacteriales bacterium]|nr:MAG: thiamine-binding protein [Sphingobacteriales bacterium]